MEHGVAFDIALCIIAAWVVALIAQVARQPLLLAYLAAGFIIGPHCAGWITDAHSIETISSIGLMLLLFMIGLEIDLKKMTSAGKVITITSLCQILGCLGLGWLFFKVIGPAHSWLEGLYLGVAAAMSSTVIIVKLLYQKRELETLAGRITLGVLVLEDLFIILFLAVQPNLKNPEVLVLLKAFGRVLLLIATGYVVSRFVLPPIFKFIARLPEMVLVGALAWCFAMAGFAGDLMLSREMGALVAGVMISTFPYTLDVTAKVTSIRDFFVTLFFVALGMQIPVPTTNYLLWMVIVSMLLVGTRLVTVFLPLYFMRQGYRVSLVPAINLCQMSELSLVLLSMGKAAGDVSPATLGIASLAFAFLAVDSTYAVLKTDYILRKTIPWLNRLGFRDLEQFTAQAQSDHKKKRICLLGFFWTASSLLEEIERLKPAILPEILVVDFNPQVYERLRKKNVHVVYGDITQRDVLHHAGVSHAELIIYSLPNTVLRGATNLKLLRQLRDLNATAQIVVHAELLSDIPHLYAAGASYVSAPRLLEAADLLHILDIADKRFLDMKREEQEEQLGNRREVLP